MAETWPATVPYEVRPDAGDLESPFRDRRKTDLEDGLVQYRRSVTVNVATYTEIIMMTAEEFRTFVTWVKRTLVDGTLPFTKLVWTGATYESKVCSYPDDPPYRSRPVGPDSYQVVQRLEVRDY